MDKITPKFTISVIGKGKLHNDDRVAFASGIMNYLSNIENLRDKGCAAYVRVGAPPKIIHPASLDSKGSLIEAFGVQSDKPTVICSWGYDSTPS